MFAVQHGGWCASAKYAYRTYGRYGKCRRCRNGKGGPWANDVYVLRGECNLKGIFCRFNQGNFLILVFVVFNKKNGSEALNK